MIKSVKILLLFASSLLLTFPFNLAQHQDFSTTSTSLYDLMELTSITYEGEEWYVLNDDKFAVTVRGNEILAQAEGKQKTFKWFQNNQGGFIFREVT